MTLFFDKGHGDREEKEVDLMDDTENRIAQLEREVSLVKKGENESLKQSFAYEFFQKIAYLNRKEIAGNKSLCKLAEDLLMERKRRTVTPLERAIRNLGVSRGNK